MTARYLLCPGMVRSRTDRDQHHVGARELAMLYRVRMVDCLVMPPQTPANHRQRMGLFDRVLDGELIALHPRSSGEYPLLGGST